MPREIRVNALMAIALGALEGGLLGVLVKNAFGQMAPEIWVNFAVALVSGAPALGNLTSLGFAQLAHGRSKTRWVSTLMGVTALSAMMIAVAPLSPAGLIWLCFWMVVGRLSWSGVMTLRAAIWRANFPRPVRARITGRITVIYSLLIALSATVIGGLLEAHPMAWRVLFPIAGLLGLLAAWQYRRFTVRGQGRLLKQEADGHNRLRLSDAIRVLREDRWYRRYMSTMFLFGSGNLMVIALLVVILTEQLGMSRFDQVLVTTTIPLLGVALCTPFWAARLDRMHVLDYRARHSWSFVAAMLLFASGAIFELEAPIWIGALLLGAAFAGGKLGWNLGHNDFSSDERSTLYMAIHVTLTGIRGLLAPLLGMACYQALEAMQHGLGSYVLLLPLALTSAGAVRFVLLASERRKSAN
ncbi:MAG: hypothetical protein Kow0020_00740 [Wenzhouxiangellaceae bacterium]